MRSSRARSSHRPAARVDEAEAATGPDPAESGCAVAGRSEGRRAPPHGTEGDPRERRFRPPDDVRAAARSLKIWRDSWLRHRSGLEGTPFEDFSKAAGCEGLPPRSYCSALEAVALVRGRACGGTILAALRASSTRWSSASIADHRRSQDRSRRPSMRRVKTRSLRASSSAMAVAELRRAALHWNDVFHPIVDGGGGREVLGVAERQRRVVPEHVSLYAHVPHHRGQQDALDDVHGLRLEPCRQPRLQHENAIGGAHLEPRVRGFAEHRLLAIEHAASEAEADHELAGTLGSHVPAQRREADEVGRQLRCGHLSAPVPEWYERSVPGLVKILHLWHCPCSGIDHETHQRPDRAGEPQASLDERAPGSPRRLSTRRSSVSPFTPRAGARARWGSPSRSASSWCGSRADLSWASRTPGSW